MSENYAALAHARHSRQPALHRLVSAGPAVDFAITPSYNRIDCMTTVRTLLSVRLEPALAEALDEYCASTGQTRSSVVQEGVAQYLVSRTGPTLHSLAEAVLPPLQETPASPEPGAKSPPKTKRPQRFRAYVRAKRRR